jgi:adenosylhomocysteine nucleosidase
MTVSILVTFAVEPEFSAWRRSGFRKRSHPHLNLYDREGSVALRGGLRVLLTGVGEANARRAVGAALDEFRPDVCISSGFAGGLRQQHRARTLLAARAVARLEDRAEIAADAELVALACALGAREAVFLTVAREIVSGEEKRRLGSLADAVEMESYGVLAEAAARGIPAAAVRAVCDTVERNLPPGFARVVDAQGRVRKAALAKKLLTGPQHWGAVAALGRESSRAAAGLAEFLSRFVVAFIERPAGRPRVEATVA